MPNRAKARTSGPAVAPDTPRPPSPPLEDALALLLREGGVGVERVSSSSKVQAELAVFDPVLMMLTCTGLTKSSSHAGGCGVWLVLSDAYFLFDFLICISHERIRMPHASSRVGWSPRVCVCMCVHFFACRAVPALLFVLVTT